ncbi:NAD-dependent epimerase/dehydratase family protein [Aeromonas veronii]|uniref:NAD-dependent epimerase/dehydratase family protein n=1 Tax=Aeromonas veronii TaxID=654 RepID=UPI001FD6711E|nr:NAD-dependent epimerase/dehydratase family protein [Aeromonas veronii]MCJ8233318.1 NAD-dependent epimerase/dehydratase family protein [Aeromonas veronii]
MNIAIIGATSQVFHDLINQWINGGRSHNLFLFARNVPLLKEKYAQTCYTGMVSFFEISKFSDLEYKYDAIINFIGGGDPAKIKEFGKSVLCATRLYDDMVLSYLDKNEKCKYLYISSGAVYSNAFSLTGVESGTHATYDVNNITDADYYSISKFYAETIHRANKELFIVDIRIFNIFSDTVSLNSRFFITDAVRAIISGEEFLTSSEDMIRDYIHPSDLCQIIDIFLTSKEHYNLAVDCYSGAPISKFEILDLLENEFKLKWRVDSKFLTLNASGIKRNYYSKNNIASEFGFNPKYKSADVICDSVSKMLAKSRK